MWSSIYEFLERYSGVSYDFSEDFQKISGNIAMIEPYQWYSGITNIMKNLQEAIDVIDEFGDNLHEDMPNKHGLKKIVATHVLRQLIANINNIKTTLNIEVRDISDYDNLENQISLLNDLIGLMIDNSLEDILHHDLYNKYEEDEDGGGFLDVLGIHENDIPNINLIITSIREDYFASLEDEE